MFVDVKNILDPENRFNPEIKAAENPPAQDQSLRFQPDDRGRPPFEPCLVWPEGFVTEVEKCHGCSKCATVTVATRMCPVYKFTRRESAAPKAKANVLRLLCSGKIADRLLFDDMFRQVMDDCVNCGSCQMECPSNVDIPKMALEAKRVYLEKFGIPLPHRLLTSVELAGRWTRKPAAVMGPAMEVPLARRAMEAVTGISAKAGLPEFKARSLFDRIPAKKWKSGASGPKVVYFSGCYAGYIRPEIGEAAVNVLTRLGMEVILPPQACCGLPHLSKGMVGAARKKMEKNLGLWASAAKQADAVVVTCSSCGLSLLKEWGFLSQDPALDMIRGKLVHISRLVLEQMKDLPLSPVNLNLGYHAPCHLRVQPHANASMDLLEKIPGARCTDLASHCCGMAGTWGLLARNRELSLKIGAPMITRLHETGAAMGVTDCTAHLPHAHGRASHLPIRPPRGSFGHGFIKQLIPGAKSLIIRATGQDMPK